MEEYPAQDGDVGWGAPRWQKVWGACIAEGRALMADRDTFEAASAAVPADDLQSGLAVDELMGALVEEYRAPNGYVDWDALDCKKAWAPA